MDSKPLPKTFFHNLDVLRFIAFLAVFISHIQFGSSNELFNFLVHQGRTGVDLFFVISGFLITYLLLKEKELFSTINLPNFFIRRSLRIYPLYLLIIFLLTLFHFIFINAKNILSSGWWMYFVFLGNFDRVFYDVATVDQYPGSGVLWSISVEEQFYIFIPLLIFFILKNRLFLYTLLLIHCGTYLYKFWVITSYSDYALAYRSLYFHSICQFSLISLGCVLAYLAYYHKDYVQKIANLLSLTSVFLLAGLFFFINYLIFKIGNIYFETIIATEAFGVIFALIVTYVCFNKQANVESKSRFIKFINYLGKTSYGLYIYHVPSIMILEYGGISNPYLLFVSGLSLSILVAHLSYKYFESYFMKFKGKFSVIRTRN